MDPTGGLSIRMRPMNRRMTINVFPYAPNDPPVPRKLEVAHLQHKLLYKDIVLEKKQKTHMNM